MPTRRQIIQTLLAAGAGAAFTGLYTWRVEPHWLEFTYPLLPVAGLPTQLEGKTLAQITDTHIGPLLTILTSSTLSAEPRNRRRISWRLPAIGSAITKRPSLINCGAFWSTFRTVD